MLHLYNTATQKKEPIAAEKSLSLYVCGVTPYSDCHLGHARTMMVFDVLVRYLRSAGQAVQYVRNITDIDDKIIAQAQREQCSPQAIVERYVARMNRDFAALNLLPPDQEPTVTGSMAAIIAFVEKLLSLNVAYLTASGDVYFQISQYPAYGQLSGAVISEMQFGHRDTVEGDKRHPADFALWKSAERHETGWESPWGWGRPGWHIECSAMSATHLPTPIDIHGGGHDLLFPHHENECAQSQAAGYDPFVRLWMHVGFVELQTEKMSKSLGNVIKIYEVLERYSGETIRLFLLSGHYRKPIQFSWDHLQQSQQALRRLYQAVLDFTPSTTGNGSAEVCIQWHERFGSALQDDLNTPMALSVLFDLVRAIHQETNPLQKTQLQSALTTMARSIGLLTAQAREFFQGDDNPVMIEEWIEKRTQARLAQDWKKADEIRDALLEKGIVLEDTALGTTWRRL